MKKILYLSDPEPDFGSTQLYMGLCQLLGDENIIDFPYKYCLHGEIERFNEDIDVFIKDNPTKSVSGNGAVPWSWIISSKGVEYHYNQIVDMIKNGIFDMILLPPRTISTYYLKKLIHDCNNIPPVILCDFEDTHIIRTEILAEFHPHIKVVTKSSYSIYIPDDPRGYQWGISTGKERIYSLSLASPLVDNPTYRFDDNDEHKTIDISARLGLTRYLRASVVESLQKMEGKTVVALMNQCISHYDYAQELAKSRIAISMRGHGICGYANRHWEIPSYNTLMLCEQSLSYYGHPFEDWKTCVHFNPEIKDDVSRIASYLLGEGENERKKIAKAGNDLLRKYHTCKARAQRLIDITKEEALI